MTLFQVLKSSNGLLVPGGSDGKESTFNAGDPGPIPGLERYPGEGNGNLLPCSCPGGPKDKGGWRAAVQGVTESWTSLNG